MSDIFDALEDQYGCPNGCGIIPPSSWPICPKCNKHIRASQFNDIIVTPEDIYEETE